MIFRTLLSLAIVIVYSLIIVPVASAHNMQPRVEISMERLNPGGIVDVRGVSFGMEETVTLTLIGSSAEIPLGEILSDAEGEFMHIAVLPSDLVEGTYYFRATTSHHWVISPPLTVWGTAVMEGGGQGLRDDDDGLLAPMPTLAPVAATAPVPSAPVEATPTSTWSPIILALAALIFIGIVVAFGLKKKRMQ